MGGARRPTYRPCRHRRRSARRDRNARTDPPRGGPGGEPAARHHLRTRQALLTALVRRLVALDQRELQETGDRTPVPRNAEELVTGIAAFLEQRLTGEGRRRSLARYACAIESVHHPELREILVPRENAGRRVVQGFLASQGIADAEARTVTLLTCVDGLVFDRLVSGGSVSHAEIRGLVAAALR